MLIRIIKNFLKKRREKNFIIRCEMYRIKEDFVYRFLLANYERKLKDTVDFGAWWYATRDIEHIKATHQLDKAYTYAKKVLNSDKRSFVSPC